MRKKILTISFNSDRNFLKIHSTNEKKLFLEYSWNLFKRLIKILSSENNTKFL